MFGLQTEPSVLVDSRPSYHHDLSGVRCSIIGFGARGSVFWAGFCSLFFFFLEPRFPHLFNENDAVDCFELSIGAEVLARSHREDLINGRCCVGAGSVPVSEESFLPNALFVYICAGFQKVCPEQKN